MAEQEFIPPPLPRTYPWHDDTIAQVRSAWSAGRLPHAILLQGADGLGKRELAAWFAAAVLCEESSTGKLQHCGKCASCQLVAAGTHPDYFWVRPEEGKQLIAVETMRDATERLTRTAYRQGYKIAVIDPAHQMTIATANSLLKTLEEPASQTSLILVTSRPSSLLPTVRSRCQKLSVRSPGRDETLKWLSAETGKAADPQLVEFTGNAPLLAREFAGERFSALNTDMQGALQALFAGRADVTQVATVWGKKAEAPELPNRLTWLDLWLTSIARMAIGGNADLFTFPARSAHLPSVPATLNITAIYGVVDQVRTLKAQLARTALQKELALESLLIAVLQVVGPAQAR